MRPSIVFLAVVIALLLGHLSTRFLTPLRPTEGVSEQQTKQRLISTHFTLDIIATAEGLQLTDAEVHAVIRNGFEASFIEPAQRDALYARLDAYWQAA